MASRKELRAIALQQSKNQLVNALKAEEEKEPDVVRLGAIDPNRGNRTAIFLNNGKASNTIITFNTDPANDTLVRAILGNNYVSLDYVSVFIKKRLPKVIEEYIKKLSFPVITFLYSNLGDRAIPEGFNKSDYWLTGGFYLLGRIKSTPSLGFGQDADINEDGGDAFLQNAGNGKYLAATRSHERSITYYGGALNRGYQKNIFTIQKENKIVVKIASDFYGNFVYLGNGIYQSFIEDGIGQIFNKVPDWVLIPDATMRQLPDGLGGTMNAGIRARIDEYNNPLRLDANILPETSNFVVYAGELHQLSGSLFIDLANIFDRFKTANELIASDTILVPTYGGEPMFLAIKDRTFGWRNKIINHQTWLPTGNSVFNYSSIKREFRNNLSGDENTYEYIHLYNYTFNETMSGELMLMSWKDKYITSTFEVTKESKDWITEQKVNYNPWVINVFTDTKIITSKTEVLTLKTYGDTEGEKNIVLNSDGKYLILPKLPKDLNSNQNIEITKDTTAFRINFSLGLHYADYDPGYSVEGYVGEPIITSFVIGGKAYLIRGVISNAELILTPAQNQNNSFNANFWFTIQVTEIKSIPQIKFNADLDYTYAELPFPGTIVLDNGCFWNYYLSYRNSAVDTEAFVSGYPYFRGGNTYSRLTNFRDSLSSYLLCDQATKYIHTNPITVPFCTTIYYPPSHLLMVDNLVNNSIYRVNDDYLIQAYIERYSNSDLSITQIPVTEWEIKNNGDIKYKRTFTVKYLLKRPFYNKQEDESDVLSLILTSHSYYP